MRKILGILGLLVFVLVVTAAINPQFTSAYNLENLVRWTALFGVLSIGVAFVIVTGGIDLSIGSVVGLVGALLPMALTDWGWSVPAALALVLALSAAIGLGHGLLIVGLRLQPFVVTLCGLLFYRGAARFVTDDATQGFGAEYAGLRALATGKPVGFAELLVGLGAVSTVFVVLRARRRGWPAADKAGLAGALAVVALGTGGALGLVPRLADMRAPTPFLILVALAAAAGFLLNETVWGRHLLALGANERAARYSGVRTGRLVVSAYVLCSLLAGLGGVLFALDVNSVQPSTHGSFYELYAIAAAVLGGCSLRGGEGSILGVVIGAAVMRTLYNAINLLEIPTQLEFAIIGAVILLGVVADELVRRAVARRRLARRREGG